ncbi:hypothetical protein NOVO_07560 [Rickettsiales bacterium Ac37b]|nr:hypothetical protein NOVO_07560 [Rickettsiales bacterium Ac37b]
MWYNNKKLILFFIVMLSACAPIYGTKYNYIPPEYPEGRTCVSMCLMQKGQCFNNCNNTEQMCISSAQIVEMAKIATENNKNSEKYGRYDYYHNYNRNYDYRCDSNKTNCENFCYNDYNLCYQNCGGMVIEDRYCTAFCK